VDLTSDLTQDDRAMNSIVQTLMEWLKKHTNQYIKIQKYEQSDTDEIHIQLFDINLRPRTNAYDDYANGPAVLLHGQGSVRVDGQQVKLPQDRYVIPVEGISITEMEDNRMLLKTERAEYTFLHIVDVLEHATPAIEEENEETLIQRFKRFYMINRKTASVEVSFSDAFMTLMYYSMNDIDAIADTGDLEKVKDVLRQFREIRDSIQHSNDSVRERFEQEYVIQQEQESKILH
jgi:hypothetical protein